MLTDTLRYDTGEVENGLISTQENFPLKENFVKCDWPTQIFRRKNILKFKIFNFNQ
jgi:hypothetical protein